MRKGLCPRGHGPQLTGPLREHRRRTQAAGRQGREACGERDPQSCGRKRIFLNVGTGPNGHDLTTLS